LLVEQCLGGGLVLYCTVLALVGLEDLYNVSGNEILVPVPEGGDFFILLETG
jgi:hypothetical protein